jgi:nicotinate-nucleotide pyrophosphorylase (carboxylating)
VFDPPITAVRRAVSSALAEDLEPLGDLTAALVDPEAHVIAEIVPRRDGVLAGTRCFTEAYTQIDPLVSVVWQATDGDRVGARAVVGVVEGPLPSVLTGERTALNFLCHLSGVATLTARFVDAVAGTGARIWDTRKTLPGLRALEKAAVRAGGAVNHRGSLSEFVLVKDNHLGSLSVGDAVHGARDRWPGRTVEVECEHIDQVAEAVAAGATMVLLDNMTPAQVRACVDLVAGRLLVEVSGGVTLDTVRAYAEAGPDLISTSAITQSAPAFDIGLDLVR